MLTTFTQFHQCDAHTASSIYQVMAYSNLDDAHRVDWEASFSAMGCLDAPDYVATGGVFAFECSGELSVAACTSIRGYKARS